MKILIYNWRDLKHEWAGGSEVYIFELAKRWVNMGHEVTFFCGQNVSNNLKEEEVVGKIRIYRRGNKFTLYFWGAYYYLTKFHGQFDVIVDVENGTPFFTPLFSRTPKVCLVHHVHGSQFFYEFPFPLSYIGFLIERYLFPIFYKNVPIIAVSNTTKNKLAKLGFQRSNIAVVHNAVKSIKKTGFSQTRFSHPTFVYLGRIKKYKRVDMLVRIMPEILKKVPNANLIIAGWGTEASTITDISMRSAVRKRVKIMGPVSESEKKYLLSKSWIFVNPSIGEGWGLSVIEANLYGTPAIAFRVPGLSESIKDKETGLLAENEKDLVSKILFVLMNQQERERLSKNAFLWAKQFNWDESAIKSSHILKKAQRRQNA